MAKIKLPPAVLAFFKKAGSAGGKKGGSQGGKAAAARMTKAARHERARKAGKASALARRRDRAD